MLTLHKNRTNASIKKFFQEMLAEPSNEFNNFCGMSSTDFEFLLQKIGPLIAKKDTKWRDSIPFKVRLAVTFRFLASGDSYKSLHITFKISSQIISNIVMEVCAALYRILKKEVKVKKYLISIILYYLMK
nr:unnamed protein product [Callosobruchus chinensis]